MPNMEQCISSALFAAKQLERAFYDAGPWFMRTQGKTFEAIRIIRDDRVVFVSMIDIPLGGNHSLELLCRDDVVGARLEHISSGVSQCSWHLVSSEARVAY